jgi:hypothetical protein
MLGLGYEITILRMPFPQYDSWSSHVTSLAPAIGRIHLPRSPPIRRTPENQRSFSARTKAAVSEYVFSAFNVLFTILNQREVFLASLLLMIALLSSEILLPPSYSFLFFPYVHFAHLHPHVVEGLLFVSVTTLVLFFASGMYQEKIEYANQ